MRTGHQIRQDFVRFFEKRDHSIVASASLVPVNDPTLLFTNSGMVQFKDVFLGTNMPPYVRAVDYQKCMRVAGKHNDLEDVGRDDTHHTFFEMLGNWSFGDYYKQEAISWAWELLTEVWGLGPDRLYVTVFHDDHGDISSDVAAASAWCDQPHFDKSHLFYCGRRDNFWEMADTGPCGPCSEIHVDLRPGTGEITPATLSTPRFLELWNLVFIQYNRISKSNLEHLETAHVDTGMGLERIASILQQTHSNYQTDLLWPLITDTQQLAGHTDKEREQNFTPYRVIADHARAAAFLIADGVTPGNTGRNYVCRMIIRRAARFGKDIGLTKPFLAEITNTVVRTYTDSYPELATANDSIANTITDEECRFERTIDSGLSHLSALVDDAIDTGRKILTGSETFNLYATYGLPLEISRDIALKDGIDVDDAGYQRALNAHRRASGPGRAISHQFNTSTLTAYKSILREISTDQSLGDDGVDQDPYGPTELPTTLLAIVSESGQSITNPTNGDHIGLIVAATPFYIEGGGQVSDTGTIAAHDDSWKVDITAVARPTKGLLVHFGNVALGTPCKGDRTIASVDAGRRLNIARNHTATHVLHRELRALIGDHVHQSGSLVGPDRLRFDYSHNTALTPTQTSELAHRINTVILADYSLIIGYEDRSHAINRGATALFDEKYGDSVRTVQIGPNDSIYSLELCAGNHVKSTAQLGTFIIMSESSVSAGTRRIEALTGVKSLAYMEQSLGTLAGIYQQLESTQENIVDRLIDLLATESTSAKKRADLTLNDAHKQFTTALTSVSTALGFPYLSTELNVLNPELLLKLTDTFYQEHPTGVVVLGAKIDGRARVVVRVSEDLLDRGLNAATLVSEITQRIGGSGGGKNTVAHGGGKKAHLLTEVLSGTKAIIARTLREHN